jgi:hypothetical protein
VEKRKGIKYLFNGAQYFLTSAEALILATIYGLENQIDTLN